MSNASAAKPVREIVLEDGQTYYMCMDFNALCTLEQVTGNSSLDPETYKNISASHVRALMFAALKNRHPELTLEGLGEILAPHKMPEYFQAIIDARFRANNSDDDEKKTTKPPGSKKATSA